MRPAQVAEWYLDQGVKGDALGNWLFSQGDKVHWCAAAFLAWCRESGNWFERSLVDRGKLRSVASIVNYAKGHNWYCDTREDAMRALAEGGFAGLGYVMARDGDPYGHIGMYLSHVTDETFVGVEGNVSDSVKAMRRTTNEVTGWILIPQGGPV